MFTNDHKTGGPLEFRRWTFAFALLVQEVQSPIRPIRQCHAQTQEAQKEVTWSDVEHEPDQSEDGITGHARIRGSVRQPRNAWQEQ